LALITLSGTSAMHMFVPALPAAAAELGTTAAFVQMTISVYILGLGLGQLAYGPLADSFGRRPLLLAGLVLFTLSGCVAAFAPSVEVLVAARFAQALGGCVGLLLPRAIVRDTSVAALAVKRLALMSLMTMAGPGLSPLIGGAITASLGWRAVFLLLTCLGAFNFFLVWRLLPETGTPTGRISAASVWADYRQLLGSRRFAGYALGGGCATTASFAFITAAPFIFVQQLHRPLPEVGLYLAIMVLGALIGNALASWLSGRVPIGRLMVRSHQFCLASAVLLLASILLVGPRVDMIVGLTFLHSLGAGVCSPVVSVQVMGIVPRLIGSAAGLYGCLQMVVGAVCAILVTLHPDAAFAAALVLVVAGLLGQAAFKLAAP
jgi:DHA1 family bicyclomycin/chloramphenicol resistance-like MFS transporter